MDKITVLQHWDSNRSGMLHSLKLPDGTLKRVQRPQISFPDPTPGILLEADQRAVFGDVVDWLIHPDLGDRVLTIGGYGGTGKTTLIRHIDAYLHAIRLPSAITTLMNRAVLVLQQKGVHTARTMHSLLYTLDHYAKRTEGILRFIKNSSLLEHIVVIDEAQTLSAKALQDFLSFSGVRLILVGDPDQLEPVGGDDHGLMRAHRLKLEEIRRQALGSNVIKIAHAVRQGKMPTYGQAPGVAILPRSQFMRECLDPSLDQIIVGFNNTRHRVNQAIRQDRGFKGSLPVPGDKVICLNNCPSVGLHNGQIFRVMESRKINDEILELDLQDGAEVYSHVKAVAAQFGQNKLEYEIANKFLKKGHDWVNFFDYGDAISCHKAIGSQWGKIAILEECHREWDLRRWAYSAMTRAVDGFSYYR